MTASVAFVAVLVAVLLSAENRDPFASYNPRSVPTTAASTYISIGFVGDSYTGGTTEGGGPLTENWTTIADPAPASSAPPFPCVHSAA